MIKMAEKLSEHPVIIYLTFVVPIVLLFLGILFHASLFQIIVLLAWIGVAFVILFLPVSSDNGSSS
jgi:hypothetical protein